MPIYEYKCDKCEIKSEHIENAVSTHNCPVCGVVMRKLISAHSTAGSSTWGADSIGHKVNFIGKNDFAPTCVDTHEGVITSADPDLNNKRIQARRDPGRSASVLGG